MAVRAMATLVVHAWFFYHHQPISSSEVCNLLPNQGLHAEEGEYFCTAEKFFFLRVFVLKATEKKYNSSVSYVFTSVCIHEDIEYIYIYMM